MITETTIKTVYLPTQQGGAGQILPWQELRELLLWWLRLLFLPLQGSPLRELLRDHLQQRPSPHMEDMWHLEVYLQRLRAQGLLELVLRQQRPFSQPLEEPLCTPRKNKMAKQQLFFI